MITRNLLVLIVNTESPSEVQLTNGYMSH